MPVLRPNLLDARAIALAGGVPDEGAQQIRECLFNKLLGIEYDGQSG
jgi:hypothetical protein